MKLKGKIKKLNWLKYSRDIAISLHKPKNLGYCCICNSKTVFIEKSPWLRENYKCLKCGSSPRQRALVNALNFFVPHWRCMTVHESSPSTASSAYIKKECKHYSASHYYPDKPLGSMNGKFRCENLSRMTFEDESFDLFITQDVFEHVMDPFKAFSEIGKKKKKGGAHVFTLGWNPNTQISEPRSILVNEEILHLKEPQFHGNPIDEKGSLVTWDWGMDIGETIFRESEMITTIFNVKDKKKGLDGETIEVLISRKV